MALIVVEMQKTILIYQYWISKKSLITAGIFKVMKTFIINREKKPTHLDLTNKMHNVILTLKYIRSGEFLPRR